LTDTFDTADAAGDLFGASTIGSRLDDTRQLHDSAIGIDLDARQRGAFLSGKLRFDRRGDRRVIDILAHGFTGNRLTAG
jgi:hypothetical protein